MSWQTLTLKYLRIWKRTIYRFRNLLSKYIIEGLLSSAVSRRREYILSTERKILCRPVEVQTKYKIDFVFFFFSLGSENFQPKLNCQSFPDQAISRGESSALKVRQLVPCSIEPFMQISQCPSVSLFPQLQLLI